MQSDAISISFPLMTVPIQTNVVLYSSSYNVSEILGQLYLKLMLLFLPLPFKFGAKLFSFPYLDL